MDHLLALSDLYGILLDKLAQGSPFHISHNFQCLLDNRK